MKLSKSVTLRKAAGLLAVFLCTTLPCHAAGLVVWSAGAVKPALEELAPEFQKATGTPLDVEYAPVGVLMRRLAQGNIPDVLILSADVVKEVEARGWVSSGSAVPLGSVGVGVAVKQGGAIPDISTPEALSRALLAAKSVTYMDPQKGTSGKHFADVLAQLGIAEQIRPKTTLGDVGYVLEPVARGEIELGVQQITEILPVKGAVLVGPLPASLQKVTTYSLMPTVKAGNSEAFNQLRRFLQMPEAKALFKLKGFMVDR